MYYKFMRRLNLLHTWYGNLALAALKLTLVIGCALFCHLPLGFWLLGIVPFVVRGYCYGYCKNYERYKLRSQADKMGMDAEERLRYYEIEMCLLNTEDEISFQFHQIISIFSLPLIVVTMLVPAINSYTYGLFVGSQLMLIFDLVKRFKTLENGALSNAGE